MGEKDEVCQQAGAASAPGRVFNKLVILENWKRNSRAHRISYLRRDFLRRFLKGYDDTKPCYDGQLSPSSRLENSANVSLLRASYARLALPKRPNLIESRVSFVYLRCFRSLGNLSGSHLSKSPGLQCRVAQRRFKTSPL